MTQLLLKEGVTKAFVSRFLSSAVLLISFQGILEIERWSQSYDAVLLAARICGKLARSYLIYHSFQITESSTILDSVRTRKYASAPSCSLVMPHLFWYSEEKKKTEDTRESFIHN